MIFISITLTLFSIFLWRKTLHSKLFSTLVSCLVFISFLISGVYYVADNLTGSGIDESVIYHLKTNLGGAAYIDFSGLIIFSLIYLLVITAASIFTYKSVLTEHKNSLNKYKISAALLAMVIAFYLNPAIADITLLYKSSLDSTNSVAVPELFIKNEKISFNGKPKNIVYLYLESVERTYLDENLFPDLMPNLKALEAKSLSFTNIHQVYGTGWTMGGMTASQCGIPLVTPSGGNSMSGMDKFLPEAICIGDLLAEHYNLNYMGGARLDFAGKGDFYSTHGFDMVEGYNELAEKLEDPNYKNAWGLYDDSLFAIAKRRYDELSSRNEPFGLFLITVDTHQPNGYISKSCKNIVYQDGSNPILNAVHCADEMVANFIKYVMNSDAFKNTILVVSSDHLAMPNTARKQLEAGKRRNLLMIFGKEIKPHNITKHGSTLDIAPTVLNLLGADIDGLGFGRDLMREAPTLSELDKSINSTLHKSCGYLSSLWSYPQLDGGIQVDTKNKQLFLADNRFVDFPALFILDKNLNVTKIHFHRYNHESLPQILAKLNYDQRFLWIDSCSKVAGLGSWLPSDKIQYCAVCGTLGSKKLNIIPLDKNLEIKFSELTKAFTEVEISKKFYQQRMRKLDRFNLFGTNKVVQYTPRKALGGHFAIGSAGYGAGRSYVRNIALDNKTKLKIVRGLTIIGLNAGKPVKLGHIDTCRHRARDVVELDGNFGSIIERFSEYFGAFVVIADDSALCGRYDFEPLFKGTGLKRWSEIGYMKPYIGLIAGNGDISEYVGNTKSALAVEARDFVRPVKKNSQRKLESLPRVAHAGGGYDGAINTNSIEALNYNKNDYELFELDFSWTSDKQLVCLHDWNRNFKHSFGLKPRGKVTLDEFKKLVRTRSKVEKCTLDSLADWLKQNKKVRIVTDIKERNLDALRKIVHDYPNLQDRFVPQVYQPFEYFFARSLGFDDVIWTLYRYSGNDNSVLRWLNTMDLYGLTMPKVRAERGLGQKARKATGVLSWVHTINSQEQYKKFTNLGINQIYTDWMPNVE